MRLFLVLAGRDTRPLADEDALFKTFDLMYGDYVGVRVGQQDSSSSPSSSSSSHDFATLRANRIYSNLLSEIHQVSAISEEAYSEKFSIVQILKSHLILTRSLILQSSL